jgi:hypothetical protein
MHRLHSPTGKVFLRQNGRECSTSTGVGAELIATLNVIGIIPTRSLVLAPAPESTRPVVGTEAWPCGSEGGFAKARGGSLFDSTALPQADFWPVEGSNSTFRI